MPTRARRIARFSYSSLSHFETVKKSAFNRNNNVASSECVSLVRVCNPDHSVKVKVFSLVSVNASSSVQVRVCMPVYGVQVRVRRPCQSVQVRVYRRVLPVQGR